MGTKASPLVCTMKTKRLIEASDWRQILGRTVFLQRVDVFVNLPSPMAAEYLAEVEGTINTLKPTWIGVKNANIQEPSQAVPHRSSWYMQLPRFTTTRCGGINKSILLFYLVHICCSSVRLILGATTPQEEYQRHVHFFWEASQEPLLSLVTIGSTSIRGTSYRRTA